MTSPFDVYIFTSNPISMLLWYRCAAILQMLGRVGFWTLAPPCSGRFPMQIIGQNIKGCTAKLRAAKNNSLGILGRRTSVRTTCLPSICFLHIVVHYDPQHVHTCIYVRKYTCICNYPRKFPYLITIINLLYFSIYIYLRIYVQASYLAVYMKFCFN